MAASEYLSTKAEQTSKEPVKASIYTGIAYIITVALLILPYLVISNYFVSLALMMTVVFLIIAFFSFYMSVLKDEKFSKHFFQHGCYQRWGGCLDQLPVRLFGQEFY